MGRNKTALQRQRIGNRDQRRAEAARLYKEGWLVKDIAARLNVTRQTIHADLCELHGKWLRQAAACYSEAKVRVLLELDQIEEMAETRARPRINPPIRATDRPGRIRSGKGQIKRTATRTQARIPAR